MPPYRDGAIQGLYGIPNLLGLTLEMIISARSIGFRKWQARNEIKDGRSRARPSFMCHPVDLMAIDPHPSPPAHACCLCAIAGVVVGVCWVGGHAVVAHRQRTH